MVSTLRSEVYVQQWDQLLSACAYETLIHPNFRASKEPEEQTVSHSHDYSTCCRHVDSNARAYMCGQRWAHFSIHTIYGLKGLSIHSAHAPTLTVTMTTWLQCDMYDHMDEIMCNAFNECAWNMLWIITILNSIPWPLISPLINKMELISCVLRSFQFRLNPNLGILATQNNQSSKPFWRWARQPALMGFCGSSPTARYLGQDFLLCGPVIV